MTDGPLATLAQLLDACDDGDAVVADPDRTLRWAEVRDLADRLHSALAELGLVPGDRVAIHLETSARTVAAVHGVLRAGAVVVPVDPRAPVDHVGAVLADCDVDVMITDAPPARVAGVAGVRPLRAVIGPDDAPPDVAAVSWASLSTIATRPAVVADADDIAYVIYTSGSTGTPKGIVHSHRSGLAYARLAAETYDLRTTDVVATLSPLHFDQSTFSLYAAPFAGSSVLMVPDAVIRFPASLSRVVEEHRVSVWYSAPTLLRQVLRRGVLEERDLTSLRWILYGGESFPPAELAALMRRLPGARVSNVYGPAEVNQCTYFHLDAPPVDDDPIPIGVVWPETEITLVDEQSQPTPPGQRGEILVRTSTAMMGYWRRPELTQAAFRTLDDDTADARRWYATGDLGSWRSDGALLFHGRADHQVKVRGHRVELEAVDLALARVDGVDIGVVVAREGAEGTELVAIVTATDPASPPDSTTLRRALGGRLPAYAVPSEVVVVDVLPLTTTGKVDRRSASALLSRPAPPPDHAGA